MSTESADTTTPTADLGQAPAPDAPAAEAPAEKSWSERLDEALSRNAAPEPEPAPEPEAPVNEEVSWDDAIASATPEQAAVMKKLRAAATQKFQEAAELRRQAQADREALLGSETFKRLQEMAASDAEVDMLDPKSIDAFIDKKVAQRLEEVLRPVQQAHHTSVVKQKYEAFIGEHPELKTDPVLRNEVAATLRANEQLGLEEAYYIVRGRQAQASARAASSRKAAARRAARAAALTVSTAPSRGSSTPSPDLAGKSGADIYAALLRLQQASE